MAGARHILPTVDESATNSDDLPRPFKPTTRPMTGKEFDAIAASNPFAQLPLILVPDGLGDLAPPIMCYGVDIDPDILVAYAVEHGVTVYYDNSPTCSEYEFDEGEDDSTSDSSNVEEGGKDNCDRTGRSDTAEHENEVEHGSISNFKSNCRAEGESKGDGRLGSDDESDNNGPSESDSDSEGDDEDEELLEYVKHGPPREGAEIDMVTSMKRALLTMAEEKNVRLTTRLLKLSLGVQRMAVRRTSVIASFYTNYDLGNDDLPTTDDIEKLRVAVGSEHPAGWYLDRSNLTWERYMVRCL